MTNPYPPPPLPAGATPEVASTPPQPVVVPENAGPGQVVYAAPTAPGAFARTAMTWWNLLRACFSGEPARVTDAALGTSSGGSTHWTWISAALVNGGLLGLALVLLMARLASELEYYFAPDGSEYVRAFLIPIVCAVALIAARAGAICALFAIQKRSIGFKDAAALAGVPFVVAAPLLALVLVLSLIPGTFALVVLMLAATFTAFYAEIALYVAVARVGRFPTSPALPHSALSAAWLCLMVYIGSLIVQDLAADLVGTLGGVL